MSLGSPAFNSLGNAFIAGGPARDARNLLFGITESALSYEFMPSASLPTPIDASTRALSKSSPGYLSTSTYLIEPGGESDYPNNLETTILLSGANMGLQLDPYVTYANKTITAMAWYSQLNQVNPALLAASFGKCVSINNGYNNFSALLTLHPTGLPQNNPDQIVIGDPRTAAASWQAVNLAALKSFQFNLTSPANEGRVYAFLWFGINNPSAIIWPLILTPTAFPYAIYFDLSGAGAGLFNDGGSGY